MIAMTMTVTVTRLPFMTSRVTSTSISKHLFEKSSSLGIRVLRARLTIRWTHEVVIKHCNPLKWRAVGRHMITIDSLPQKLCTLRSDGRSIWRPPNGHWPDWEKIPPQLLGTGATIRLITPIINTRICATLGNRWSIGTSAKDIIPPQAVRIRTVETMVEGTPKLNTRFDRLLPLTTKGFGSFRLNELIGGDRGEASSLNMACKVSSEEPGDGGHHGCIEGRPLGPDMGTEAGPHAHQERNDVDRGK